MVVLGVDERIDAVALEEHGVDGFAVGRRGSAVGHRWPGTGSIHLDSQLAGDLH